MRVRSVFPDVVSYGTCTLGKRYMKASVSIRIQTAQCTLQCLEAFVPIRLRTTLNAFSEALGRMYSNECVHNGEPPICVKTVDSATTFPPLIMLAMMFVPIHGKNILSLASPKVWSYVQTFRPWKGDKIEALLCTIPESDSLPFRSPSS